MESCEEPLNLTVKKMPIAIVAPFAVHDPKMNNNNEEKFDLNNKHDEETPQDLSVVKLNPIAKNNEHCLDLSKGTNWEKSNLNQNEQLRNYLCKNDAKNHYNKNTFNEQDPKMIKNDPAYSMFNLTDRKLLSAWYMNSVLAHNPYLNHPVTKNAAAAAASPPDNRILNNLLDKKPYATYKFPNNFDALIVNEMQSGEKDKGGKIKGLFQKVCVRLSFSKFLVVSDRKWTTRII